MAGSYRLLYLKAVHLFFLGAGNCDTDGNKKAEVLVYMEDKNDHTIYIIEELSVDAYQVNSLLDESD